MKTLNLEAYLAKIPNLEIRIVYSKFKLSDHSLIIEKGRHLKPKVPREHPYFPFCPNSEESESHFLLICNV